MALNRKQLQSKLSGITSELLKEKGYISFVDVFMKLGYLDPKDYESWRMKRVQYLERVIKINLGKINFIMKTVRRNCLNGNLNPSLTGYKSRGKGRKMNLRFSKAGEPNIEKLYATHFVKKSSEAYPIAEPNRDINAVLRKGLCRLESSEAGRLAQNVTWAS